MLTLITGLALWWRACYRQRQQLTAKAYYWALQAAQVNYRHGTYLHARRAILQVPLLIYCALLLLGRQGFAGPWLPGFNLGNVAGYAPALSTVSRC